MEQTRNLQSAKHAAFRLNAVLLMSLAAAGSASAATLSVGPGKAYAAPCAAFAKAKAGDVIEIDGSKTYSGDVCAIGANDLTIRGVNGRPKIDAAGKNAQGKAIWVVKGNNIKIENVEMYGAKVADKNGAALRLEGTNFTLRSSFLHDNENGILSGPNANSNVVVEYSEFGYNGHGDGYSHNLYIGKIASLVFRFNYSHDANIGHNLKSRAMVNTIAYNRFSSTPAGQSGSTKNGKPSYEIDLPNAGTAYVIGNVIHQPSSHSNPNILAYAMEGATNPRQDLYVVNNTFLNDDSSRGVFVQIGSKVTTPALIQNNIFGGTGTMTNQAIAIDKTNFRSVAPAFINRAAYDLHPGANVLVINAGSAPGKSASGFDLTPTAQYKHAAASESRPTTGALDIGAYEAGIGGALPAPTLPTPTPTPPTQPAPAPTPGAWTVCANEGGTCTFSGSREVRYGAPGYYVSKVFTGSVQCSNAVFGDPKKSTAKNCSYAGSAAPAPAPTPAPSTPVTWTQCATEGGTCSFTGTREVRYGAPGYYNTKSVTARTACTNAVFGDPKKSTAKSCSYSSQAR